MSNNNELIADSEELYELVNSYSSALNSFSISVDNNISEILSTLSNLHSFWTGSLYDEFAKNIKSKISRINLEIDRCNMLKSTLDKSAIELDEVIKILKSSSEG